MRAILFALAGAAALAATAPAAGPGEEAPMSLEMHTTAFDEGGTIPARFTCTAENLSPALSWTGAPEGTKAFALICDDPDAPAGTWVHWVAYDLPGTAAGMPEALHPVEELPGGGRQGRNDFGKLGYGGPCPPPGKPHRYFFKLYALSEPLGLDAGATKKKVESAMKGRILAETHLMGRFSR